MGPPIKRVKTGGGNCELRNVGPNEMRKQLRYTCDKRVLPRDPSKYAMQRHFGGMYAAPTLQDNTVFVPREGTWGCWYAKHRQNVPCVATPERTFKPGTFALCN